MSSAHDQWMEAWTRCSHNPESAALLRHASVLFAEAEDQDPPGSMLPGLALVRRAYERTEDE